MTGWAERRRIADLEWRMERDHANTVPCPQCDAPAGECCTNQLTGDIPRFPAHPMRIKAANDQKENHE